MRSIFKAQLWDTDEEFGAARRDGPELQDAAEGRDPRADADDAQPRAAAGPRECSGLEADAVVGDAQRHLTLVALQPHRRARRARVTDDVGEGLLGHPVEGSLDGRRQSGRVGAFDVDLQPAALRDALT